MEEEDLGEQLLMMNPKLLHGVYDEYEMNEEVGEPSANVGKVRDNHEGRR